MKKLNRNILGIILILILFIITMASCKKTELEKPNVSIPRSVCIGSFEQLKTVLNQGTSSGNSFTVNIDTILFYNGTKSFIGDGSSLIMNVKFYKGGTGNTGGNRPDDTGGIFRSFVTFVKSNGIGSNSYTHDESAFGCDTTYMFGPYTNVIKGTDTLKINTRNELQGLPIKLIKFRS